MKQTRILQGSLAVAVGIIMVLGMSLYQASQPKAGTVSCVEGKVLVLSPGSIACK